MAASSELRALLDSLRRQLGARWTLGDVDALIARAEQAGRLDALRTLAQALASDTVTPREFTAAVQLAVPERDGVSPAAVAGSALAAGLVTQAVTTLGRTATRALTTEQLRPLMTRLEADFRGRAVALAEGLAQGRVEIDAWQRAMQQELRAYHSAAARLGSGDADLARQIASRRAAEQVRYLNGWADELRDGRFPVDAAGRMRLRAGLYAGAGNGTYAEAEAQRIGLPAMPAYPTEGSECRTSCGCRWEYVQLDGDGNWDCFWRPGPTEHCPTCKWRVDHWNPLRVRNGVIVN